MQQISFKKSSIAPVRVEGWFESMENPYPIQEFRIDLKSFISRLPDRENKVTNMYLAGFAPKFINEVTEVHLKKVYRIIESLPEQFKEFYLENQ